VGEFGDFSQIRGRLLDSIPEFLRRNIRGHSPSEQVFHLFLAFLHDASLLESLSAQPEPAHRALSESIAFIDRLLAASGAASTKLALVVTNGRCLVALSHGHPVQYIEVRGVPVCPVCGGKESDAPRDRAISHDQLKAVILEADHRADRRAGWQPIPDGGALLVGPKLTCRQFRLGESGEPARFIPTVAFTRLVSSAQVPRASRASHRRAWQWERRR